MNQDESVALWRRGKGAWNDWAEDMLRQKAELEESGTWNSETVKWMVAARTDLSSLRFMTRAHEDTAEKQVGQEKESSQPSEPDVLNETFIIESDGIDFSGFVFPWQANFRGAQFHGEANFRGAQFHWVANFRDAQFQGGAEFESAQFHGWATFWDAQFHKEANFVGAQFHWATFENVEFHRAAGFRDAQFQGGAEFESAQFHGWASFEGEARFHGDANFEDAQFHGDANFGSAQFQGQAKFPSAHFERSTSFRHTLFGSKAKPEFADFAAIKADRAFDLTGAQFSKVPAFSQADFKQAPDLDNVSFPPRPFWLGGDEDLVPQYRALKRLAVQGYDYEREQMAFKGELRSRRRVIDKWYGPSMWLGMFYDFFADCGRSIWRPFATWAVLVLGFAAFYGLAAFYFSRPPGDLAARCGSPLTAAFQALYLSIKNGLVLFGGTRDARVNQAYRCLYGSHGSATDQADIPLSVTYVETLLQTPISAALLFLFLLAVRNQFKIK